MDSSTLTSRGITILFISLLVCGTIAGPARGMDRLCGRQHATRSVVMAQNGMVCASQPLAAQIGVDILKQGGNAVDAAIALNAALGVIEPVACGIGGDLFAIVWDAKTGTVHGLNASGRSPYLLTLKEMKKRTDGPIPYTGVLPQTVPGCVDGWFQLHEKFGRLPMAQILAPAIEYAEKGFPVTQVIAYYWEQGSQRLKDQPNFAATFMPGGKAPQAGAIFANPDLAATYRKLAKGGRKVFYRGELADVMDAFSRKTGGFLRKKDFEDHSSQWVEPLSTDYRGHRVWELPPNGQGLAALQMLNILERFDLRGMGFQSADALHLMIEAKKLAFEDRARFYADPDFNQIPLDTLLSKDYAGKQARLIDASAARKKLPSMEEILESGDTTYLTVVDGDRNFVSLIQSNYAGFGSGPVPDGLGFCLQDRGALFNLDPDHPNALQPHKRPFHTIIPALVSREG